ncbi:serine hydrolase domain-containing protein [Actinospica sp.]|jgi:CubicO group peptidase (beta-lactamase class C family)|uniref:serine hydrolase domain-containing protein n=1 Tax=Actinospica sp. TaxID=1872142 RepID=UPI002CC61535|nr:serine hydrolase domain-containing protein [Actinospica sp.]HWG25469.1 serine hydrolase domain-containing protein [Actinospica sp.]
MAANDFTPPGLNRLHRVLSGYVQRGTVPGLVAAVAKGDSTHVEVLGRRDVDRGEAMSRDSIFRIASMSKPITAVAALTLVEDCVLRLDDPVEEFLPELADRRVLKSPGSPLEETVPAERPITLRDLLSFRAGFGGVWNPDWPITAAMQEAGIAPAPPRFSPEPAPEPDLYLRRLGELPLIYQPGEAWLYHMPLAVTGVLIARASGRPFPEFLRERLFEPLGMDDTAFHVPPEKQERLVSAYRVDPESGALELADPGENSIWSEPPPFPDGGGDLVSTVDDYLAFARMLLGGGIYSGTRILSRPSVELMTTDHLTAENRRRGGLVNGAWDTAGWGFGVQVTTARSGLASVGRYGWDGGLGTAWFNDSRERLIGILLTQRLWQSPQPPDVAVDFETGAYAALAA